MYMTYRKGHIVGYFFKWKVSGNWAISHQSVLFESTFEVLCTLWIHMLRKLNRSVVTYVAGWPQPREVVEILCGWNIDFYIILKDTCKTVLRFWCWGIPWKSCRIVRNGKSILVAYLSSKNDSSGSLNAYSHV